MLSSIHSADCAWNVPDLLSQFARHTPNLHSMRIQRPAATRHGVFARSGFGHWQQCVQCGRSPSIGPHSGS